MALALLVELVPAMVFGPTSALVGMIWVPIVEEVVKLLPVGLFLWFATRGNNRQPAITDGLLLGFAVGAGFAFYEDGLAYGLVPILAVVLGTLAAVAFELRVLDWVSDRAPKLPSVSLRRQLELLAGATSVAGFHKLRAATRYARHLRAVYYAAWRTEKLGAAPTDSRSELAWLGTLADRADLTSGRAPAPPADATAPVGGA